MTPEAELLEAANDPAALLEADARPRFQILRDAALPASLRKVSRACRSRFRSQRTAILKGQALRKLHATIAALPSRESLRESRKVTGSVDAPLTDKGREQARATKARVGETISVYTAPNARSRETGRLISGTSQDADWLRPWNLGALEGKPLDSSRDDVNRLISDAPDESPGVSKESGKEGESFNAVSERLIGGALAQQKAMKPGERVLNITSGRVLHIIHAAARNNFQSVDKDSLTTADAEFSKPGDLFVLQQGGLRKLGEQRGASMPGQYFAQHGETVWNSSGVSESLREADDDQLAAIRAEIAAALGPSIYGEPVSASDQQAYAKAVTKAIDTGAAGVSEQFGIAAPETESFIAEYLKDGGFTRLTGELDKTSVDRLASAIADAYEEGGDFDSVVDAIKSEFQDFSTSRAKMIAQTELNDAFGQSVLHFGREAGATTKTWETDLTPCVVCIANALQGSIDLDEDFESGDDAPPAHPNCMCSLIVGVV
jgi:broad specificity phosphatase PhoE